MRNAVLHLITNKSDSFGSELLPMQSRYVPHSTTAEEDRIRTALLLNTSTYHLHHSLVAVYAFPDILQAFKETESTFLLNTFLPAPLVITNASYYNTQTEPFNIVYNPSVFLPATTTGMYSWTIKYVSNDTLELDLGYKTIIVPCIVTSDIITATWPAESGIKGAFQMDSEYTWTTGYTIYLSVPPVSFNYTTAVQHISSYTELHKLISGAGLARNFFSAQSDIEKYAIVMLALGRPDLYNIINTSCDVT